MASDPLLDMANSERNKLLAELEADPRFKRLRVLDEIIEKLGGAPEGRPPLGPFSEVGSEPSFRQGGKTELIANAVERFLRDRPGWHHASEIYEYVTSRGIEIGGKNPKSNLTAHMSSAGRFVSDRAKGWRLKTERDVDDEAGGSADEFRKDSSGTYEAGRADVIQ